MNQNLRIGQAAERLGVTTSTVRNYLKIAPDRFSSDAIRKTGKRFNPEDLATLQEIQRLLGEGFHSEEIPARLPVIPEVIEQPEQPPQVEAEGPGSAIAPVEFFQFFNDILESQKEQYTHQIEELQKDKEKLERQLAYKNLPWYFRLFTKPPD